MRSSTLPAHDARHVQQVVHQPHQALHLPLHHLAGERQRLGIDGPCPQNVEGVLDGGQWVAQFVGQHRQKLVLAPVGLDQFAVEAGVLEGNGGAVGQILRQGQVGGPVAPPRLGRHEGQHAQNLAVGRQRHAQVGLQPQLTHQPQVVLVAGACASSASGISSSISGRPVRSTLEAPCAAFGSDG